MQLRRRRPRGCRTPAELTLTLAQAARNAPAMRRLSGRGEARPGNAHPADRAERILNASRPIMHSSPPARLPPQSPFAARAARVERSEIQARCAAANSSGGALHLGPIRSRDSGRGTIECRQRASLRLGRAPATAPRRSWRRGRPGEPSAASKSRNGWSSGKRLRPHCSHDATITARQCSARFEARAASSRVTLRCHGQRRALRQRLARPPSGSRSPSARRRPGLAASVTCRGDSRSTAWCSPTMADTDRDPIRVSRASDSPPSPLNSVTGSPSRRSQNPRRVVRHGSRQID